MKKALLLTLAIVLGAGQAFGQAGVIALYADDGGADCNLTDASPGMLFIYVIHTGTSGTTGSRWAAPLPACMTGVTWLSDTEVFPITVGDSQDVVAITYDGCLSGPLNILRINVFAQGLSGTCCQYWVVPDPYVTSGEIEVVDCDSNTLFGQGALATVNGDGTCPCGGFKMPQSVVGGGCGSVASANYATRATVGQPATGTLSSSSFGSDIGYWHLRRSTVTGVENEPGLPKGYSLDQNFPNPFNPSTTIRFTLPKPSYVTLQIYDVRGRLVTTLVDRDMPAGAHREVLQADGLTSGVYFCRIKAEGFAKVRKLVVLK
jgi:hypothetical protein